MTRRILALAVLAFWAGVPALELACPVSCTHELVAGAADACDHAHDATAAGHPVATADAACCHRAVATAVPATATAVAKLEPRALVVSLHGPTSSVLASGPLCRAVPRDCGSGPPGRLVLPLRI